MKQPTMGMRDLQFPDHVCGLCKAIYGLNQVPHAWYDVMRFFLIFTTSRGETLLFVLHRHDCTMYFLVYVDNLIITCSDSTVVANVISLLDSPFSTKDLGSLSLFCGVKVLPSMTRLLLCC